METSAHCRAYLAKLEDALTAAFAEMHDINCMTAGESPFGANATEEEVHAR
jgi:hypothetical protein